MGIFLLCSNPLKFIWSRVRKVISIEQLIFWGHFWNDPDCRFKHLSLYYGYQVCLIWFQVSLSHTHTVTHLFNGPLSGTAWVSRYQKGKTSLDFTEARDSEQQWHQLGCVQVCTSLQTDNHASTPPLSFLQAGCPFCRPANSIKALKLVTLDSNMQRAVVALWRVWWLSRILLDTMCDIFFNVLLYCVSC